MERLKEAREMGDLSENGAYKYAKFELGSIGRQLRQLRFQLDNGVIVAKTATDTVSFGSCVTVTHSSGKRMMFTIVSSYESNPLENKLSMDSPIGSALLGKKLHESVVVQTPAGEQTFTILKIE